MRNLKPPPKNPSKAHEQADSDGDLPAFYRRDGDSVEATARTRGPWNPDHQHAGPPAALIAREIELLEGVGAGPQDRQIGRITYEILRPVPIGRLRLSAEVERPGRTVDMVSAVLSDDQGTDLIRARAWRIALRPVEIPGRLSSTDPEGAPQRAGRPSGAEAPMRDPGSAEIHRAFFPTDEPVGYHSSVEIRSESGGFDSLGPAAVWMRPTVPLFAEEELSPLQRTLVCADSGNGVSCTLDFERYMYVNVDLSVHLVRPMAGEWVGLDALTIPEPTGVGLTDTMLWDERGPIGRACQTLVVAER